VGGCIKKKHKKAAPEMTSFALERAFRWDRNGSKSFVKG